MSDRLRAVLGERYGEVIERAARGWKPYLWEDFAENLERLRVFTNELAEAAAAKKRKEAREVAADILAAVLPDLLAEAWDEGHETPWKREPDDCECYAYSRNECGCGRYGMGRIITPNPYREETKP